ncbi:hypothetical protein AB0M12_15790 [Nocardia vinacea]
MRQRTIVSAADGENARVALQVVADIPGPRILEFGACHGKLSAKIVEYHHDAVVTVSDLDPLGRQHRC